MSKIWNETQKFVIELLTIFEGCLQTEGDHFQNLIWFKIGTLNLGGLVAKQIQLLLAENEGKHIFSYSATLQGLAGSTLSF